MKKLLLIFAISLGFGTINQTYATHEQGGDISYLHISGNDYLVTATLFVDCAGLPGMGSINLDVSSSCNSFVTSIGAVDTIELAPQCIIGASTCNGGTLPGARAFVYSGMVTLPPCNDWYISYSNCCRNNAVINLQNAGTQNIHMGTYLDNSSAPNSSPIFQQSPLLYMCNQGDFCINNTAYDIDGDSLVFTLVDPKSGPSSNIPYNAGYSASQPFGAGNSTFNSANGNVCVSGAAVGAYQAAVEVREFRNGNLIAITTREFQTQVINCGLSSVEISGNVNDGVSSYSNVKVYLFEHDIDEAGMTLLDSTLTNASGDYTFSNLAHIQYMTKAEIDTVAVPGYLPSYHMGSYYWNNGQIIYSTCDSTLNGDIELAPTTNPVGIGVISGYLNGFGVFRSGEVPMHGYRVYLIDMANDQLVAHAQTNEFGFYEMNNLPDGDYRILVDVPGLIHTSYHFPTISVGATAHQMNYTATPDGIFAGDWTSALDIQNVDNKAISLYPNPAHDNLIISSSERVNKVIIHDVQGKIVKQINHPQSQNIDVSNLLSGIYVVRINGRHVEKFVKE